MSPSLPQRTSLFVLFTSKLRNVSVRAATSLGEIVLICYLIHRKLARSHFWLFFYLCGTVAQSALGVVTYSLFDFKSSATRNIIWGSQAVVITMRFLAACEMARRILACYAGIWAFAQRVLLIVAAGVLLSTAVFSDKHPSMMILTVDHGAENGYRFLHCRPAAFCPLLQAGIQPTRSRAVSWFFPVFLLLRYQ